MSEYELFGLERPMLAAKYGELEPLFDFLRSSGTNTLAAIIYPSDRAFFLSQEWELAGTRTHGAGQIFLLLRRLLNRSQDGVIRSRRASNTTDTLRAREPIVASES